jgi:hypothetical protein
MKCLPSMTQKSKVVKLLCEEQKKRTLWATEIQTKRKVSDGWSKSEILHKENTGSRSENTLFTNIMEGNYMLKFSLSAPLRRMGDSKGTIPRTLNLCARRRLVVDTRKLFEYAK